MESKCYFVQKNTLVVQITKLKRPKLSKLPVLELASQPRLNLSIVVQLSHSVHWLAAHQPPWLGWPPLTNLIAPCFSAPTQCNQHKTWDTVQSTQCLRNKKVLKVILSHKVILTWGVSERSQEDKKLDFFSFGRNSTVPFEKWVEWILEKWSLTILHIYLLGLS